MAPSFALIVALLLGSLPLYPVTADEPHSAHASLSQTLYLPSVSRRTPSCSSQAQPNIFGVQMYGNTGSQGAYYDSMIDTNADWVRVQIAWSKVEPQNTTPANYNWSRADVAVAAAVDACKQVIVTHVSAPDWAADSPNSVINSENLDDFVEYISTLVERYNGNGIADAPGSPVVRHWELYNEPDLTDALPGGGGWGEYPEEYAQMLAAVYPAIKASSADAQVLLGGLAYDWFVENGGYFVRTFLDDVLEAGGGDYFDILNFHSYPGFGPVWIEEMNPDCVKNNNCEGPGLLEKTEYLRGKLEGYKPADTPVIITESGWHSNLAPDQPSTPEIQARYVTELYVQSKAAGVEAMIFFALVKPDFYAYDTGLVTKDAVPKPKISYNAYQTAVFWLVDAPFIRRLNDSEMKAKGMDGYQFLNPKTGRTFYVAWLNPAKMGFDLNGDGKPDREEDFETLRLPGNEAKVYDILGNLVETVTDTDGEVKVLIGGDPRYIEITK